MFFLSLSGCAWNFFREANSLGWWECEVKQPHTMYDVKGIRTINSRLIYDSKTHINIVKIIAFFFPNTNCVCALLSYVSASIHSFVFTTNLIIFYDDSDWIFLFFSFSFRFLKKSLPLSLIFCLCSQKKPRSGFFFKKNSHPQKMTLNLC